MFATNIITASSARNTVSGSLIQRHTQEHSVRFSITASSITTASSARTQLSRLTLQDFFRLKRRKVKVRERSEIPTRIVLGAAAKSRDT